MKAINKPLSDYEYYRNSSGALYYGNCYELFPKIKEKIDLVDTDPPYNFNAGGGKGFYNRAKETIIQKLEKSFGHKFNPDRFLKMLISKKDFHVNLYLWTNKNLIDRYLNWARANKFSYNILTWHKINCPPLNKNNYLPDTEYLLFFRKKGAYFDSTLGIQNYRKYWITTVNTNRSQEHPCPKPLSISFPPVKISCPAGGTVCDPFFGTGTTGIVAMRTGRRWIGIDNEKKWCELAKRRLINEERSLRL